MEPYSSINIGPALMARSVNNLPPLSSPRRWSQKHLLLAYLFYSLRGTTSSVRRAALQREGRAVSWSFHARHYARAPARSNGERK